MFPLKALLPSLLMMCSCFPLIAAEAEHAQELQAGMVNPGYEEKPAWFKESFLDMREDVAEAAAAGRRVMLYFYQDGCPYCAKLLRENFADQDIVRATREHFDVVAVNIWGDREVVDLQGGNTTEKAFAKGLKVQFTPTLLFLDETGRVVLRINGYFPPHRLLAVLDYVGEKRETKQSFRDYFAGLKLEKASGRLHREAGFLPAEPDLAANRQASSRLLLVMFEQPVCRDCDSLHQDILQRPAIRDSLDGFDVALLDAWTKKSLTTPDGRQLPIRDWARELGVHYTPTLVFFDTDGKEVFRTEAHLRGFHIHAALDYVLSGAYREQPEFQRFVQERAEDFRARGIEPDLMK